jgi:hypothetical protein
MAFGLKARGDPFTAAHPHLPETLSLWEKVTRPKMYFDPMVRGFIYVEVYDPGYWMRTIGAKSQDCLHPMYRMRARNTNSAIDGDIVAFWTTKYADVVAPCPGAVAAASVHFGFPLWFFNRTQANAIADEIFKEWQISAE